VEFLANLLAKSAAQFAPAEAFRQFRDFARILAPYLVRSPVMALSEHSEA